MRREDLRDSPGDDAEYLEGDVPTHPTDAGVAHAAGLRFETLNMIDNAAAAVLNEESARGTMDPGGKEDLRCVGSNHGWF
jgi:hypothetical protein